MNCGYCQEPMLEGEDRHMSFNEPTHFECGFRSVVGSVAHLLRRCDCYCLGSTLHDPPGMTKREAARAALDLYRQMQAWFGEKAAV